jgi:hypothetical protein
MDVLDGLLEVVRVYHQTSTTGRGTYPGPMSSNSNSASRLIGGFKFRPRIPMNGKRITVDEQ